MAKKTSEVLGGVSRQAQTLSKQALEDKRVRSAQVMPFGWPQNLVFTGALNNALANFSSQRQSAGMFVVTTEGKRLWQALSALRGDGVSHKNVAEWVD